jgi:3-oxoacyl-[acyl-carrier-protein] synthase II
MRLPIVGMGAVASVGDGVDDVFATLCAGRGGPNELRGFDRDRFSAGQLFEIDDRPERGRDVPGRATEFLLSAVAEAAADAGLGSRLDDVPILVGTGLRELRSLELWWCDGAKFTPDRLHFGTALRERFGATDTHTFSNACSASLYALAFGADLLELGEADTVIVAGVDSVTTSMFGLADRVQPIPPERVLPFDRKRTGTILGEGAAAVVLRRDAGLDDAHGVLRSVAVNCDAYHPTAPDLQGIVGAIRRSHDLAGVGPEDVDLVLLHGTGTPLNDQTEARAFAEVFGDAAGRPLLTGIKSMTGHTSGSAGVLSLIVAIRALISGEVPPITGVDEPIEEVAGLRLVLDRAARGELSTAQVQGFGFGGVNAVAIVEAAR